jgi:gamma-glutamylcyclotransferase (GGCT)/AIG2-like uncharacterized protein YtfP
MSSQLTGTQDVNTSPGKQSLVASATQPSQLLPLFIYGTLMSSTLLAGLLTGDERQTEKIEKRKKRATLQGYSRHRVLCADFPALIPGDPSDRVDGYLFYPESLEEMRLLHDFECDSYYREEVEVVGSEGQAILAYVYLWCDNLEDLEEEDWDFEEFEAKWVKFG